MLTKILHIAFKYIGQFYLTKRHGRVSALKCMRETDRVSIRKSASYEHLKLSDLNNS